MSDEHEEMVDNLHENIANCYKICRKHQDQAASVVLNRLKDFFHNKSIEQILEIIIETEKITSQSSKPIF